MSAAHAAALLDEVVAAERDLEESAPAEVGPDTPEDPLLEHRADPGDPGGPVVAARRLRAARPVAAEPDLVEIGELRGVPLWYERTPAPKRARFAVARTFLPVLEASVRQLQERAPGAFGPLRRISSAGMHVEKPGRHGEGLACDWDRLVFDKVEIAPIERAHASSSPATRRRYWSFAALCRSNSCFVLHARYDRVHADHVHADRSTGVGFNRAPSTVMLLQAVLNEIDGATPALAVDGVYGPLTRAAFAHAAERLALPAEIDDVVVWRRFLRRSAHLGLVLVP